MQADESLIGVGDGARGARALKNSGKYFSDNYYVKFGHFLAKNNVKFGHFVNFSYLFIEQKCLPPNLTELLRL